MESAEVFDAITAQVFDRLYASFPNAVDLEYHSFAEELAVAAPSYETTQLHELFGSTIRWLKDEGYLRSKLASAEGYYYVVLSTRGLAALNAVPRSVSGETPKSNIETIRSGLRSTGGVIVQEVVRVGVKAFIDAARGT